MSRLPFVLWLLGWPLVCDAGEYMDGVMGHPWSLSMQAFGGAFFFVVWAGVGAALWREAALLSGRDANPTEEGADL